MAGEWGNVSPSVKEHIPQPEWKDFPMQRGGDLLLQVIAKNVKALRQRRGISQRQLALKAKIDPKNVSNLEREAHSPSLDNLADIAKVLGIEVWRLMRPDAERAAPTDDQAEKLLTLYGHASSESRAAIMHVAEMAAGYATDEQAKEEEQQQARTEGPISEGRRASLHRRRGHAA